MFPVGCAPPGAASGSEWESIETRNDTVPLPAGCGSQAPPHGDSPSACLKPDPRAFQMTLERLGAKPEEAVFIDDTMEHVEAARRLGLHGIPFTTAEALKEELGKLLAAQ